MSKAQRSASDILCASIALFEENGYSQTSMRQIAAASEVSLGLINHYFQSKARLGSLTLDLIVYRIAKIIDTMVDKSEDPILYDAVATRVANVYLLNGVYRQFYIDCLVEDVFWEFLSERSVGTLTRIMKKEGRPQLSTDELDLYGKYLTYGVEKTLVLNKEKGGFPSIPYDKIPDYIIRTEMERFVNAFTIDAALDYAREYAKKVLAVMPERIPREDIAVLFPQSS